MAACSQSQGRSTITSISCSVVEYGVCILGASPVKSWKNDCLTKIWNNFRDTNRITCGDIKCQQLASESRRYGVQSALLNICVHFTTALCAHTHRNCSEIPNCKNKLYDSSRPRWRKIWLNLVITAHVVRVLVFGDAQVFFCFWTIFRHDRLISRFSVWFDTSHFLWFTCNFVLTDAPSFTDRSLT